MNSTKTEIGSLDPIQPQNHARRDMFRLAGAGGVNSVMVFMQRELVNTALPSGVDSIAKLDATHVRRTSRA